MISFVPANMDMSLVSLQALAMGYSAVTVASVELEALIRHPVGFFSATHGCQKHTAIHCPDWAGQPLRGYILKGSVLTDQTSEELSLTSKVRTISVRHVAHGPSGKGMDNLR